MIKNVWLKRKNELIYISLSVTVFRKLVFMGPYLCVQYITALVSILISFSYLWLRPNESCSPGAVLNGRSLHRVSLGRFFGFNFFFLGGRGPGLNDLLGH